MLKRSLKTSVGGVQVDGAWVGGKTFPQAKTSPLKPFKLRVDSASACRPCPGFCIPNINGSYDLEQKKGRGEKREEVGEDGFIKERGFEQSSVYQITAVRSSPLLICIVCASHVAYYIYCVVCMHFLPPPSPG